MRETPTVLECKLEVTMRVRCSFHADVGVSLRPAKEGCSPASPSHLWPLTLGGGMHDVLG